MGLLLSIFKENNYQKWGVMLVTVLLLISNILVSNIILVLANWFLVWINTSTSLIARLLFYKTIDFTITYIRWDSTPYLIFSLCTFWPNQNQLKLHSRGLVNKWFLPQMILLPLCGYGLIGMVCRLYSVKNLEASFDSR